MGIMLKESAILTRWAQLQWERELQHVINLILKCQSIDCAISVYLVYRWKPNFGEL